METEETVGQVHTLSASSSGCSWPDVALLAPIQLRHRREGDWSGRRDYRRTLIEAAALSLRRSLSSSVVVCGGIGTDVVFCCCANSCVFNSWQLNNLYSKVY